MQLTMPESKKYCTHCKDTVSATTYRRHRDKFFDESSNKWTLKCDTEEFSSGAESMDEGKINVNSLV